MTFYASSNTRTFRSENASAVIDEGKIRVVRVPVTTARDTAVALANAK